MVSRFSIVFCDRRFCSNFVKHCMTWASLNVKLIRQYESIYLPPLFTNPFKIFINKKYEKFDPDFHLYKYPHDNTSNRIRFTRLWWNWFRPALTEYRCARRTCRNNYRKTSFEPCTTKSQWNYRSDSSRSVRPYQRFHWWTPCGKRRRRFRDRQRTCGRNRSDTIGTGQHRASDFLLFDCRSSPAETVMENVHNTRAQSSPNPITT